MAGHHAQGSDILIPAEPPMPRLHSAPLHGALLGLTHPHSGKLLATLNNLAEVGGIYLWENEPGAAQRLDIPPSRKVRLVTADLDAVLGRPEIDFAIVCVQTDQAAALARRVIAAGKHLLAEKPVGLDAAEIRGVMRAATRAGVQAGVLYINRLHPVIGEARRLVQAGVIGPLLSCEARLLTTQVRFRDPDSWLFRRRHAGGGILTWLGCHYLDLLWHVSGDPITAVAACEARRSGEKIDVEDSAALALQFRSGAVGTFHAGYALAHSGGGYLNSQGYDAYLACNGRDGRVVWPDINVPLLHIERPGRPAVREVRFRLRSSTSYGGTRGETFVRQFLAALRGAGQVPATLADALRTAEVLEAVHRSARTGRLTRVDPIAE